MTYGLVPIERFGGLDVRSDPGEVGFAAAADMLDVDIDYPGRIRTRDGFTSYIDAGSGRYVDAVQINDSLVALRLVAGESRGEVVDYTLAGRTDYGSFGAGSGTLTSAVAYGGPDVSAVYCAFGVGSSWGKLEYVTSTDTWTLTGLGGAKPYLLANSPWDSRMVMANFASPSHAPTTVNGSPSTVYFSDPGSPSTFGTNNYVHLSPGDGERIRTMVAWRDMLMVFKESRAYVFTAPSVDGTGQPIFNYRAVPLGTRLDTTTTTQRLAVAGPDGVYFVSTDGIFRTDGFNTVCISRPLDRLFARTTDAGTLDHGLSYGRLGWARGRLHYSYTTVGGDDRLLVWDRSQDAWVVWSWDDSRSVPFEWVRLSGGDSVWFCNGQKLSRFEAAEDTDDATAITGSYTTQPQLLAEGEMATARQLEVTGSGTVTTGVLVDADASDANASPVASGATFPASVLHRKAYRGRAFALTFSGAAPWQVSRATFHMRERREGSR